MNAADRIALVDRLARAAAWLDLSTKKRDAYRQRASDQLRELETAREQQDRIGWILVEPDGSEVEE